MDQHKNQSLSYERLVNRAKYYKDKSLKLEKEYIFAKEKVAWLENRLDKIKRDTVTHDELNQEYEQKIAQLKDEYRHLEQEFQYEKQQYRMAEQQYIAQINNLKVQDELQSMDQSKQDHYEQLLKQVQQELNEKEELLDIYKKRLTSLEKRLRSSGQVTMTTKPNILDEVQADKDIRVMAYFDYALIVDKQRSVIRGDLVVENVGKKSIETPYICFRFYPADAARIKGRFIGTHESPLTEDSTRQWSFLSNDWANEAKERGEIWIHPVSDFELISGEKVVINDFQIPIDTKKCEHVTVESFIYAQSVNYRVKSVNQIIANF